MKLKLGGIEIVARGKLLGISIEYMNSSSKISSKVGLLCGSSCKILLINLLASGEL
jgi:hypothetical protein